MSGFRRNTREEMDAYAREHGWYTSTEHPPLPFLAIVAREPEDLIDCDDMGRYPLGPNSHGTRKLAYFRRITLVTEIVKDERYGAFGCYEFARPYRGPCYFGNEEAKTEEGV